MAKADMKTDTKKPAVARKDLPEVLDVLEDRTEAEHIIELIERGHAIKKLLGAEPDKKTGKPFKGEPGYGLLAEMRDIKDELKMAQESNELDGLRFGRIGAVTALMDGRSALDKGALLEAGVTPEQLEAGYKTGDSYWQTTLFEIKTTA